MMDKLGREKEILNAKVKFILMVIDGKLKINNRKRADLLEDLKKKGFKAMSEIMKGSLGTFSNSFKFWINSLIKL